MPGKWSSLKGSYPSAPVDMDFQARVNTVKQGLQATSKTERARKFCELRDAKDELEAQIKEINTNLEALSQLMILEMETAGETLFRLDSGDSLSIKDEPYSSVVDKDAFINYIEKSGQKDLLTVHYMTMNSMVKERLQNGQEPPPGIKVYVRQSIMRRRGR